MTLRELERKLSGRCTRCGAPAGDTNLCRAHELDLNARVAASLRATRKERRDRGECVDCGERSERYRCGCKRPRSVSTIDSALAIAEI